MDIAIIESHNEPIGMLTGDLEELIPLADKLFSLLPAIHIRYLLGTESENHPVADIANRIKAL